MSIFISLDLFSLSLLLCAPLLKKNRYEVAPRSDSEESGSEFEEEVSDLTVTLITSAKRAKANK